MSKINCNSQETDPIKVILSGSESLAEKTQCLEVVTALLNVQMQLDRQRQDENRHNHLMREAYRLHSLLGIPQSYERILNAMTTSQLDDYIEDLLAQWKNRSVKSLKVA